MLTTEQLAEIRESCKRAKELNDYIVMFLVDIEADRDRWKARCEAMERAITEDRTLDHGYCFACFTCINFERDFPITELNPCCSCSVEDNKWQFREARFAGERGENNEQINT